VSMIRSLIQQVPPLYRAQRRLRDSWHRAQVDRLTRQIADAGGYEVLVVFGMRRSGNHLALGWILDQIDGPAVFYNNINPSRPPYSARMTELRRHSGQAPRIVLSYEDVHVAQMLSAPLTEFLTKCADQDGAPVRFAVILRDPYNLFASRLKKWPERFAEPDMIAHQQALYTEHAALARAPTPLWRSAPLVPVLYNQILTDPETRRSVADGLGIRQGDQGLDRVSVYGHGSSFDGTQAGGDVFARWRSQADAPQFRAVVDSPDITAAAEHLFAMAPPEFSTGAS